MVTQQQRKYKILLIGDNCIDVYQFGTVDRLSPEAPVPIFVPLHKEEREGMAGNVYRNLVTLGCKVDIVCGHNSRKTRLIDMRSKQHIARIDEDVKSIPVVNVSVDGYDAIVISDYNKGVVSYDLIEKIRKEFNGPIFVDTKKTDLAKFEGCIVKINSLENSRLITRCSDIIVTDSANGAILNGRVFPAPKVEVSDVTGAGDTFLAALAFRYLKSQDMEDAIKFANKAASVTVQRLGVYAPTLKEIE